MRTSIRSIRALLAPALLATVLFGGTLGLAACAGPTEITRTTTERTTTAVPPPNATVMTIPTTTTTTTHTQQVTP